MHPAYRWGGLYPYHVNPMHYALKDDPRSKEISSHMKMDPSTLSSPYQQPWSYGGNYCYSGPQECHGGYNHGYFGGPYSFQPPYPYYPPPPPPYHSHGFYPPFPGAYPAYSVPPPHYSVEQPRYDYDKNTHGSHHCCGCNHRKDEKESRIEQEEPEIEKKTSDSLIPSLLKDYPYPIMWVPPGFLNTESQTKEKEKHSHDPVPLKPLEPSKKGGNGETDQDQQGGDDNHLPCPIFWFPSKNNEVREKNLDLVTNKASPFSRSETESEMGSKPAVQKVIPVKQLGTEEEKKGSKNLKSIETKVKSGSGEKTDNGMEGKASPRTSKLPPVCLRVDPLPRKKNSSRSPSPPGDKGRSKGTPIDDSKSCEQKTQVSEGLKKSKEEQKEDHIKTIKVIGRNSLADPCENVPKGEEKKRLSENEAALIIQSACRGFQVRKSKPITKLRQIAEVGKQVVELRNRIRDLESSSSGVCFDDKRKLVIGETIMSLLLKLDTIQGLHPAVRDIRKCVAKELVGLQEKLDSLTSVKPETPIEDSTKKEDDDGIQQSDTNVKVVESAMGLCEEVEAIKSEDDGNAESPQMELQNEESSGELNNKQLDDGIQEKSEPQLDTSVKVVESAMGLCEVKPIKSEDDGGAESPEMELQKEESSGELNNKQLDDGIQEMSETQLDTNGKVVESAMSLCEVKPEDDGGAAESPSSEMELQKEESSGELNNKQLDDVIQNKLAESDSKGEVVGLNTGICENHEIGGGDIKVVDMEKQKVRLGEVAESDSNIETVDTGVCEEEGVECYKDMNNVEALMVDKNECGREKDYEEEDSHVNGIEEKDVVKEQMHVIRELTARVKDLEKKLSKNVNKKKKKGRRSRVCVEQELS